MGGMSTEGRSGIITVTLIEHIRLRTGMYMPTDGKGIPRKEAWELLLRELALDGVRAFERGEASRMEFRLNPETGSVCIGHDGPRENTLARVMKALDSVASGEDSDAEDRWAPESVFSHYGDLKYTLINALSRRVTVECAIDGKGRAVRSRDGIVGPVEDLIPRLVEPEIDRYFRLCFTADPRYLPGDGGAGPETAPHDTGMPTNRAPCSESDLLELGEILTSEHPGFRVAVNGQEFFSRRGTEDLVAKRMAGGGADILMAPVTSRCGFVTVACGATRRSRPGRRLFVRASLNGWEVRSNELLAELSRMVCDWICSCIDFQSDGFDFHLMATCCLPASDDALAWGRDACLHLSGSLDMDHPLTHQCLSMAKRCLIDVFSGMRK